MAKNRYAHCYAKVGEGLGRELTKAEKDKIRQVMKEALETPGEGSALGRLQERIAQEKATAEFEASLAKRTAAINLTKRNDLALSLKTEFDASPGEWVKSLFTGSAYKIKGAGKSIETGQHVISDQVLSTVQSRLASKGLIAPAEQGLYDAEVFRALWEMSLKSPDPAVLSRLPEEAVQIAEILNDAKKTIRNRANQAGAWIGELEGHAVAQSHSRNRLSYAAGLGVSPKQRDVHFNAWRGKFEPLVDWGRTWVGVAPEQREKALRRMFDEITTGADLSAKKPSGGQGFGNFGSGISASRSIHFTSPEASYQYFKEFGDGGSVMDAFTNGVRYTANKTAIMEKLGPSAELNLERVVNDRVKELIESGRIDDANTLRNTFDQEMKHTFPQLTGAASIPANTAYAEVSRNLKLAQVLSSYGGSMISSIPDPAFAASTLSYASGDNVVTGTVSLVKDILSSIGETHPDTHKIMSELGVWADAMSIHDVSPDVSTPGRMTNLTKKFFKYNGQSWWTNKVKSVSAMALSHKYAGRAGQAFDTLPTQMRAYLERFDIDGKGWDILRSVEKIKDSNGREYLTPEAIDRLPLTSFDSVATFKEGMSELQIKRAREKARDTLSDSYRALFSETAQFATSEPGAAERAIMAFGQKRGTWQGEALQHMFMGKSFAISMIRKHWGRALKGYSPEAQSLPELMKFMFSKPGESGLSNMAQTIAMGTMLGMVANGFKDAAKGIKPAVPENAEQTRKMMLAGLASSGGLAIYGDFLFGETHRYGDTFLKTVAGQTFGQLATAAQTVGGALQGKDTSFAATRQVIRNVPFVNLPYVKFAFDYAIVNSIHEMMNPGKLREIERKLKREKAQEYFAPPSSTNLYRDLK